MAESDTGFLRSVELRLLRCTLPPLDPPPPSQLPSLHPPNSLRPLIESLLESIERGDYAEALSSDAARLVFGFSESWEFTDSAECAAGFYHEVERSVDSFLSHETEAWIQTLDTDFDAELECRFALIMSIAVAALLAFTQQNVTGPVVDLEQFPLLFAQSIGWSQKVGKEWDMWAQKLVESVGSHLLGKFSHLQHLIFSKILLSKTKDLSNESNKSISWWLCRLILLQQRILDELSSSLFQLLQVLKNEALLQFGRLEKVCSYWGSLLYEGEGLLIVSVAQIEAGIIEYKYGRIDSSRLHLNSAEEACGMHLSVTGVLGFRTIHQVDAKSQMVLVTSKSQQSSAGARSAELSQGKSDSTRFEAKSGSFPHGHEDCDILITPRLVENGNTIGPNGDINDVAKNMVLTEIQQAVVLAQCLPLSRTSREDELSRWEVAPFIEAIDAQRQSCHIIRSFSDILRIRWESTRSRTKQRALLMMDKLVEKISEPLPIAAQRIQFSFIVHVPTIPALRKEYGELSVSCGMIPEALKIFEDLELWDNLIYCYRLLEKKSAAVDLIKARLCHTPTDPRLWCSLGDVTNNDCYYEKALEVSNNKSARAKRSLARSAYNRGDYATSKILWESAMALNSLYPDGWFALGAAALKDRDIDKALDGFTRAVQLDPDNGEAWNNIACLHVVKKKSKPAFIAFKEALKFRRNSWQIWEGYSHVAFDIGNFQQALEATKMVLDLSSNKRVDVDLLEKLMSEVEDRTCKSGFSSFKDIGCQSDCTPQANFSHLSTPSSSESKYMESTSERSRETELLVDVLGNVLKQVIRNSAEENIWGLYARWHKIKGNLIMCSEALLKQVRSYQGSDLWHDKDRFKKFAHASLQLCKVYIEIASSGGSHRELIMAEMHLKNSVKQAVNFSDTEEFKDLQSCLDEIKERLHATSIKTA